MNSWETKFTPESENDLRALDKTIQGRVVAKIQWLEKNFPNVIPEPLSNKWKDFYKLRVGDWRIVYQIEYRDKFIIIYRVDRRDRIYKSHL